MPIHKNEQIISQEQTAMGWEIVKEALYLLESSHSSGESNRCQWCFLDASKPLPFEDLLAPFVSCAYQHFSDQVGTTSQLLAESAYVTIQRHLLHVLVSFTLDVFSAALLQTQTTAGESREDQQGMYQDFLRSMSHDGLASLLQEYCELASLLAACCECWVGSHAELVRRLHTDWQAITETFSPNSELIQVIEIQPALSDTRAGGRHVIALTFANECKLVYKPRSVGMEETFYQFQNWCNEQGLMPAFKVPLVLNRNAYGWVEFIAYFPCQDEQALFRYYQQAGRLLCLVYLLGGRDCFYEQIIAHGEYPVLVDPSSLVQPYPRPHPEKQVGDDWEAALYTVLHTGLLATWQMRLIPSAKGVQESYTDISGLGLDQIRSQAISALEAEKLQATPLQLGLKYGVLRQRSALHLPCCSVLAGEEISQHKLHTALHSGFCELYQLLLQHQELLLAYDSPLWSLKNQAVRFSYRNRQFYEQILPKLVEPQALRDQATRKRIVTSLTSESTPIEWYFSGPRDHLYWQQVSSAEEQALLRGEVPYISANVTSDALMIASDQELPACLIESTWDLVSRRLAGMSREDLAQQSSLLKQAVAREKTPLKVKADGQLSVETLTSFALMLADQIAASAIERGDGSVTWLNPAYTSRLHRYQLQPMRYSLSEGVGGTALFLAAAFRCSGRDQYRQLVHAALRPLDQLLQQDGPRLVREMGLGGALGLGSLVYALSRCAHFLDEPELLDLAHVAARLITPQLIADDQLLDIFVGSAGTLLGLLALYDLSPAPDLLDLASACGQRLLTARTLSPVTYRAWATLNGKQTTGFAHGTAGIVYALLRLYHLTKDAALLEAVEEGLAFENCCFVPEVDNWTESVGERRDNLGQSWCHGAPGIGLARLGGLHILDTTSIRQDIEAALRTTLIIGSAGVDHLCCGTSGRLDLLLTAAQKLNKPELASAAVYYAEQMLARAVDKGDLRLHTLLPKWLSYPKLLQGTAGIGYTLLRLAQPEKYPSLLLWT